MLTLSRPDIRMHRQVLDFLGGHDSGHVAGLSIPDEDVAGLADPAVFASWVDTQQAQEQGREVPEGRVACTSRWIVEDGSVIGSINLRHSLTDHLFEEGGHIGYAVRPRDRGRGVATAALRLMLEEADRLGINPILVTCGEDNLASARVIERCGGVLEDTRQGTRRYWITLPGKPIGYAAHPLDERPLLGVWVCLPLITARLAESMRAAAQGGARSADWASGFPRQDDLDGCSLVPQPDSPAARWGSRLIVRRGDGLVVGSIGCFGPPGEDGVAEIGYGLVESARGQGLITDALRLLVPAIEATGASVQAHAAYENAASRAALVRAGFQETGARNDDGQLHYVRTRASRPR